MPPPGRVGIPPRRRRRRRINRRLLYWMGGGAAFVLLLPFVVFGILIATIDPNAYKEQIEASVRQSLGRDLRIRGDLSVSAAFSPTLRATNVTLANVPGGSRPEMMRMDEMTIELVPRALFTGRLLIKGLSLVRPDILLETDARGAGNWRFAPPRGAASGARVGPAAQAPEPPRLLLQTLHLREGRVTWRDGRTGRTTVLEVRRVSATATTADSPVIMSAELALGRQSIQVSAQTGPIARLQDTESRSPWGLFLNAEAAGAKLTIAGALTRPLDGLGYSLRVDGTIADLGSLTWLTGMRLPPLHNLTWSARILDTGGVLPDVSGVTVQTGLTNLDKISPGFTLDSAHIDMPRLSEPFTVTAEGNFAGTPLQLNATIGALSRLLPGARPGEAFNLDINANVAGATFGVRGSIANPAELKGMDIALGARVPDLSLLSPFAGQALPPLNTIAFAARLVDAQGGYQRGVALKGVVLTVPQGDLSGDITLNYGGRMGVQATVTSNILDLDALNAAVNAPARSDYAQAQASGSAAALDVMTPPPLPRRQTTVISDTPLPLGLLGGGDADVHASVGEFHIGNAIYRNVAATLLLQDGNLSLSPLNAETPGGPVELRLSVDTRQPAPPVALAWHSAGLDLKPLLAAFGLPESATGKLDVDADLHATGSSPHALATTLAGHLGAAITDGDVDNAILVGALADLMGVGKPAGDAAESGHTKLRCVATRLDAAGGIATLGPTVIDTQRLQMNATGRINLGDETFALRLRPLSRGGKAGSTGLMKFEGGFREAKMEADNSPPSPAVAASSADSCALALIAARGQATAPASATPPAPRHVP